MGPISQHAQFRLSQLQTMASDAAVEAERLHVVLNDEQVRYAQFQDGSTLRAVQVATDNYGAACARKQGAEEIERRYRKKLASSEFQRALSAADAAYDAVQALDFTASLNVLRPRIQEAAATIASLVTEVIAAVDSHANVERRYILSLEACGMHELVNGRPILEPSTGLARMREILTEALNASKADAYAIRAATGFR